GGFAGVDVFFVISGFLITSQLVREVERSGTVSLPIFYARRAKRLFPAAFTVLAATAAIVWLVFPKTTWRDFGGDIAGSAAYLINWRLAERSVDYLAEDVGASPVQHFWSLAVEEQYYIIWPLLILGLAMLIRRYRLRTRPVLALALTALILLPSLLWSIHLTAADPARSYFVTTTRLWELAIGALVAIAATVAPRIPRAVAIAIGWGGLALIAFGALAQSTATPWPGSAAAVPTVGAAAVILAGFAAGPHGPTRILGTRPMVWVGGLSYSLYLWHWPLVVASQELWPDNRLAPVAAVILAFLPAWAAHRWIENPVRHAPLFSRGARPALVLGLALSLAGVSAGMAVSLSTPSVKEANPSQAVGAAVLEPDPATAEISTDPGPMTPDPLEATEDLPSAYAEDCQTGLNETGVKRCEFGDPEGTTTIALVGDSKALQWLPALEELAPERDWKIVLYIRSACPFSATKGADEAVRSQNCLDWGKEVIKRLTTNDKPDVVLTSSVRGEGEDESGRSVKVLADGYAEYWQQLEDAGSDVVVVTDNPHPRKQVYACVAENPDTYMTSCQGDFAEGGGTPALLAGADRMQDVDVIDVLPWVCPGDTCWPVIGNVLVYRQGSHVTATYARSMSGVFDQALKPLVED
ncbi:MAG: acyltransferase, partial [Janibacter sp.]|nr:acyltransferase [Janibacter sp.]